MPTDVSANPLNVVISLAYAPYNAGATQNSQYQIVSRSLETVLQLQLLPFSLASQLGSAWLLNFDADLTISTPAPVQPFNFSPVVTATLSNSSLNPGRRCQR